MSLTIVSARNVSQGIKMRCPHCRFHQRVHVSLVEDAIYEGKGIICVACDEPFGIVTVRPIRVAEQRNAPVQSEQKCPSCGGKGFEWSEFSLRDEPCSECNGTGISTRSDGG